jgi:hypothetical protein
MVLAPRGRHAPERRQLCALLVLTLAVLGLCTARPVLAARPSGLVVVPHASAQTSLSYFKVSARPGSAAPMGTVELRNPTARRMRVAIRPVDGETLGTLGSSYAQPGSRPHGSTPWLHLGRRVVTLSPGARLAIPVSVVVPRGARPGDYLSGVSVEALDQRAQDVKRRGASIASVSRYAIGAEISLPGPRHPLIQFTGATVRREPSGLTFLLMARNSGNAILEDVHGHVRITGPKHAVVSQTISRGTFVAHTRIAYPVNAFRQTPSEGTHYRISAWMRYRGGIARLDTTVTFGHRAAVAQQQYGGPHAPAPGGGTAWWKIAGIVAAILYGLITTALLLRRRTRSSQSPVQP